MRRWRVGHASTDFRSRPFAGVDGEGAGVDDLGRQLYRLLRAGDRELYHEGRALTSAECLAFLADLPRDRIWVGYYFDYDATQILRELPEERLRKLLDRRAGQWIDWQGFQVAYLPRKYLRVRREGARGWVTVSDAGSFFQCAFLSALERWEVGTPRERKLVARGKARRGKVGQIDARERAYCATEVRLLGDLMEKLRAACLEVGYLPAAWQGPGYLASAMLARHGLPRKRDLKLPKELLDFANGAYYGGRFEVFRVGQLGERVWSHDINSAYPRALLDLPCLVHGEWSEGRGSRPEGDPWVAELEHETKGPGGRFACGLPVRTKEGTITWPRRAWGTYWSWEAEEAIRAGARVRRWGRWWGYARRCACQPFSWVPEVYEERRRLGKDARGLVLKLALNSCYGKLAQSVGSAPWANPIWAGLITAHTRAAIAGAYRGRERDLVMVATDGVVTARAPLPVKGGEALGEWTVEELPGIFVVQPGFYWLGEKLRTRGTSRKNVEPLRDRFRRAWRAMLPRRTFRPVLVPETLFVGLRLALARGKLETAGRWVDVERKISFDWQTKRGAGGTTVGRWVQTFTQRGHSSLRSVPYDRAIGGARELERMEHEAQPDFTVGNDR
jgi:hypothetical protein